jgi:voltage-gated potassium channel
MRRGLKLTAAVLFLAYLLTWLVFGWLYRRAANSSAGRDFIFQEDLKTRSQLEDFKAHCWPSTSELAGVDFLNLDDMILAVMSDKESTNIRMRAIRYDDSKYPLPTWPERVFPGYVSIFRKPLGPNWATFYAAKLRTQGFSYYSVSYQLISDFPSQLTPATNAYTAVVVLYKGPVTFKSLGEEENSVVEPSDKSYGQIRATRAGKMIIILTLPHNVLPNTTETLFPVDEFDRVLKDGVTSPDGCIFQLRQIQRGAYTYPFADFLYFSASTITTVGYGDIVPNSTRVRILVMGELLAGIIFGGGFVTFLFAGLTR